MKLLSAKWSFALVAIVATVLRVNVGMAQTEWEKYPGNPVLDKGGPGSYDYQKAYLQTVLFDGTEYKMWYVGDSADGSGFSWVIEICLATSPDGIVWTKYAGNPVLTRGSSGEWDRHHLGHPSVLFDGTEYKMWYSGYEVYRGPSRIGYATSPDGIVWTKYSGNPVVDLGTSGSYDDENVTYPSVLFDGIEYKFRAPDIPNEPGRNIALT